MRPIIPAITLILALQAFVPLQAAFAQSAARSRPRLSGVVFDSVAGAPLAGASVQVLSARNPASGHETTTDAQGRFVVAEIDTGSYEIGVFHPRLDSLGLDYLLLRHRVTPGADGDVRLAVPGRATLIARFCPDSIRHDSSTVYFGTVRDAESGQPRVPSKLLVLWGELAIDSGGVAMRPRGGEVAAGAGGQFVACNLPPRAKLSVRIAAGPDTSDVVEVVLPESGILSRDLFVGASPPRAGAVAADAPTALAQLTGRVRADGGEPIAGAIATVIGPNRETRTDAQGTFTIGHLTSGTVTLEISALGFDAVRRTVDLRPGESPANHVDITLPRRVTTLAPVRVVEAADAMLERVGFTERRKGGAGYFLDSTAMGNSRSQSVTQVIGRLPSMLVRSAGRGARLLMRDPQGYICPPTVWLDGTLISVGAENNDINVVDIDMWIDPTRVAGIEVYRSPALAPLQYGGTTRDACGVVLIWQRALPDSAASGR